MPLVSSGLLADYQCLDGSGTTLSDSSGNANDAAALSGTSVTWLAGVGFSSDSTQGFLTPLALSSIGTLQVAFTPTAMSPSGGFIFLAGSSDPPWQTQFGFNGNVYPSPLLPVPLIWPVYAATYSYDFQPYNIPDVITFAQDGTHDHIYLGASAREGLYVAQDNTSTVARSGNLVLGTAGPPSGAGSSFSFVGKIHRCVVYDRALSQSEAADNGAVLAADMAARGVPLGANPSTTRTLVAEGDSITLGYMASAGYPALLSLAHTYARFNVATSGAVIGPVTGYAHNSTMYYRTPFVSSLYAPLAPISVIIIMGGTNDIVQGQTPAQAFSSLQSLVNIYKAAGFPVVVVPMISRTGYDTQKNTYNGLMASAYGGGADPMVSLVPTASLPNLVPDGSSLNTTYFSDGTHPKDPGQSEIAAAVGPVVDAVPVPPVSATAAATLDSFVATAGATPGTSVAANVSPGAFVASATAAPGTSAAAPVSLDSFTAAATSVAAGPGTTAAVSAAVGDFVATASAAPGAAPVAYPTTPYNAYDLSTVYASDEDIALLAGSDFRSLAPKWLRLAYGSDGVLSGWVLTSASCDFGANEVVPGCVVSLTKSSANLTGDLFGVDGVGTGYVTLRRLGKAAGVGQPPPAATGVEFEVRTFSRLIDEASFDLNNVFGIDPDLPGLNPVVLQRPRELRRLTALSVLRQAYTENWQDKGDDWAMKLNLVTTQYDDLRARLVLHLQSTTGVPEPVRVIGMRIGR